MHTSSPSRTTINKGDKETGLQRRTLIKQDRDEKKYTQKTPK